MSSSHLLLSENLLWALITNAHLALKVNLSALRNLFKFRFADPYIACTDDSYQRECSNANQQVGRLDQQVHVAYEQRLLCQSNDKNDGRIHHTNDSQQSQSSGENSHNSEDAKRECDEKA